MFDPIMGVGKTPMITGDTSLSPYSPSNPEINKYFGTNINTFGTVAEESAAGTYGSKAGNILNLYNPIVDPNGYQIANPVNYYLIFDFRYRVYATNIIFNIGCNVPAAVGSATITLSTSEDGVSWTQKDQKVFGYTGGSATQYSQLISLNNIFRFIKIDMTHTGSDKGFILYQMAVIV